MWLVEVHCFEALTSPVGGNWGVDGSGASEYMLCLTVCCVASWGGETLVTFDSSHCFRVIDACGARGLSFRRP